MWESIKISRVVNKNLNYANKIVSGSTSKQNMLQKLYQDACSLHFKVMSLDPPSIARLPEIHTSLLVFAEIHRKFYLRKNICRQVRILLTQASVIFKPACELVCSLNGPLHIIYYTFLFVGHLGFGHYGYFCLGTKVIKM